MYRCALEVFRRDGVQAASVEEIARLAGTSRGTFYFHFPTKEDVLAELLRRSELPVAAAVGALPPDATLEDLLRAIVKAVIEEWQNDPTLFPEVGLFALRLAASSALTSDNDPVRSVVAKRFRDAASRGEMTTALPPVALADAFLMMAFGVLMDWARRPDVSLDEALDHVVRLFMHGARPPR